MNNFQKLQAQNILSSYSNLDEILNQSNGIEKARYVDNAENRKKMRVGQEYSGKSEELGKTRSGKTVYSRFNHKGHKDFTKEDHYDAKTLQAAKKTSIAAEMAKIRKERYGGDWGAAYKSGDEDYLKLYNDERNHSMHERDHLNKYFKLKKEEESKPKKEEPSKEEKYAKELQLISASKIDTLKEFKSYIEEYVDNFEEYNIEEDSDHGKALIWASNNPVKAFELYSKYVYSKY